MFRSQPLLGISMPKVLARVFVNGEERRIRALWRLLAQVGLTFAIAALPVIAIGESLSFWRKRGLLANLSAPVFDKVADLIVGPLFGALVLSSIALAARWFDRRRVADLGFHLSHRWLRDAAFGFLLSGAMMAFVFGTAWAAGWVVIVGTFRVTAGLPIALAITYTIVKTLCVSTYEEAMSRGYHLRNIAEGLNGVARTTPLAAVLIAVLLSSLVFGLLHLGNDNATALSAALLTLNGALFALPLALTGELGTSIGLHVGWNFFQGLVLGFPVSGDLEPASLLSIKTSGPAWIVGGAFGPEAGILSLGAMLLGALFIYYRHVRLEGTKVRADIAEYAAK